MRMELLTLPANKNLNLSFNFYVVTDNLPEKTQCNSSFSTAYTLPNVLPTNCVNASISWSFYSAESGANYTLDLVDDHLSASKVWGEAEFPILDAGSTVYQQYIGAPDFVVK